MKILELVGVLAVEPKHKTIHIKNFAPDETENLLTPLPFQEVFIVARFRSEPRLYTKIAKSLRIYWNRDTSTVTVRSYGIDLAACFKRMDDMPIRFEIHNLTDF